MNSMNHFSRSKQVKIGVLGGGQLGKMLIQAAIDFDLYVKVLDPDSLAPCSGIAHEFQQGSLQDEKTILEFAKDCDVVTIEIEHIHTQALEKLREMGKVVFPSPEILSLVQDKRKQKEFYLKNGFPTSPFWLIDDESGFSQINGNFPWVYKTAFAGYDGKGVKVLREERDLRDPLNFPGLIEEMVSIQKEIAVIIARNLEGQVSIYPPIEMVFHPEGNLVEYLISPPQLAPRLIEQAEQMASDLAEKMNFVGLLAVEMFLTNSDELLINEIAPRPHNSGHHTIRANMTSQFEQHLRAILNLPLGKTDLLVQGAMVNILGNPKESGPPIYKGMEKILDIPGVYVHLYGKALSRPFRKMGHITILDPERESLIQTIQQVRRVFSVEIGD